AVGAGGAVGPGGRARLHRVADDLDVAGLVDAVTAAEGADDLRAGVGRLQGEEGEAETRAYQNGANGRDQGGRAQRFPPPPRRRIMGKWRRGGEPPAWCFGESLNRSRRGQGASQILQS